MSWTKSQGSWLVLTNIVSQSTICLANKSVEFVKDMCKSGVRLNTTINDKRIFRFVHLRKTSCNQRFSKGDYMPGVSTSHVCLLQPQNMWIWNDIDWTHSKPWCPSVKTPKLCKITGINWMFPKHVFFLPGFDPAISTPSLAPGVEQFLAAVDVAVSSETHVIPCMWCILCPNFEEALNSIYKYLYQYYPHCKGFARKWFGSKGPGHCRLILDHSKRLFHTRNQPEDSTHA